MRRARLLLGVAVSVLAGCVASARAVPGSSHAQVAFMRFNSSLYTEIWSASGRSRRPLIHVRHAAVDEPAWSPSGRRIAFTVNRDPADLAGQSQLDIYVAHADGKGLQRLTRGRTEDYAPAWSPDGHKIAFAKASNGGFRSLGVFVIRADGQLQHRLSRNLCDDTPAWSPTGKLLVVARCGSLYILRVDGTHARRLTTPPPPDPSGSEFFDGEPAWSPDGRWIAFVRTEELERGGEIANLYVVRRDGTGERQTTDGGDDHSPSWAPNGQQLGYASYTRIRAVSLRTGRTRILVAIRGSDLSSPAWRR